MKTLILLAILAYPQLSSAFMYVNEFQTSGLLKCYDTNQQDLRRVSLRNINGQALPLPSSVETFVSLVERYETLNPNDLARDLAAKLLKSFRIDDLHPILDEEEVKLRDTQSILQNRVKRVILSIPETIQYEFKEDDFTDDEKCALHFMLSHTVNDTRIDDTDEVVVDKNRVKQPREFGVVGLNSKRIHAFALGRVLLGIYAGFLPSNSEDLTSILQRDKKTDKDNKLQGLKVNLVYAATLGDLITRIVLEDDEKEVVKILPNGEWNDISCPTVYKLQENNGGFITYSELRGAVDGLIIGTKIQENRQEFSNFRLSQILRQYYGYFGMTDQARTRWCSRESSYLAVQDKDNEMLNYNKLYQAMNFGGDLRKTSKVNNALALVANNIFKDLEREECSVSEMSPERKYVTPRNIFAVLDYSPAGLAKLDFQTEVIGNLSTDFEFRPRGNLMGVYSNLKPLQQNTLDVIVKNSGTAGCPSCFAKYYSRTGNKEDEAEIIRDLNDTLGNFDRDQDQLEEKYQSDMKEASPGKIVLYFNFGNPNYDNRLSDALWTIKRYFRGVTILAIGDNRESLRHFVENTQTDIFSSSPKTTYDLKQRINKIPAEFTFKACNQSSSAREADNKQVAFIPPNKIQYWAMYPQYFLKSYGITMKIRPEEGASIRVCFSRWYGTIIDGKADNCQESTGGEIKFYENDPCKKEDILTCRPFYFSVEGKKQPTSYCQSLRCSTVNDIQFEFQHEGISCNIASYVSVSSVALLFAVLMYYMQRQ